MIKERINIHENDKTGKLYEEKIRKSLELEFNWKNQIFMTFLFPKNFTI